jgi:hypothetical protein
MEDYFFWGVPIWSTGISLSNLQSRVYIHFQKNFDVSKTNSTDGKCLRVFAPPLYLIEISSLISNELPLSGCPCLNWKEINKIPQTLGPPWNEFDTPALRQFKVMKSSLFPKYSSRRSIISMWQTKQLSSSEGCRLTLSSPWCRPIT